MGNCFQTCVHRRQEIVENGQNYAHGRALEKAGPEGAGDLLKEDKMSKEITSSMRIKIVLTKEELEWLMIQLNEKEGQKLEDVLDEIGRGRRRTVGWRPSLDSISESPEVPEEMDR